ncbi:MAG TPA: DHA2 family efflux MFS transporter permease subunit, partial [Candidatus Dormibacteraeota bacterium]|nr:DHA2 family efflux MFS transporter permease subunit [Candidatus Dormibacteraeota bacterium]
MRLAYKWQAAIVVVLGMFMAVLDNTIVNVALPRMQNAFHTDWQSVVWVASAYFLSSAAVIPVTGYLSDRLGSKWVWVVSLAFFTGASGVCALAPTVGWLITFRVIQGIGAGALFPLALAIGYREFPPTERGPAAAVIGVPLLLAPTFGPTIGGYLTTTFDWQAIFLVNVPVGVVALALAIRILRPDAPEIAAPGKGFDITGLLLAMVGTLALVYAIDRAGTRSWTDSIVVGLAISGVLLLAGFTIFELRVPDPVMDMRLFKTATFTVSNIVSWVIGAVGFGSLFLIPFYFESVLGKSPLDTGIVLIPMGLAAAVAVVITGRLYNRVGPRLLTMVGIGLLGVGSIGFVTAGPNTDAWSLTPWLIMRGAGFGMAGIPIQNLALSVVSNVAMARASSLFNVTRQIFAAVGVAGLSSYLTNHANALAPTIVRQALQGTGPCATRTCVTRLVTADALNDTFFLVVLLTFATMLVCIF